MLVLVWNNCCISCCVYSMPKGYYCYLQTVESFRCTCYLVLFCILMVWLQVLTLVLVNFVQLLRQQFCDVMILIGFNYGSRFYEWMLCGVYRIVPICRQHRWIKHQVDLTSQSPKGVRLQQVSVFKNHNHTSRSSQDIRPNERDHSKCKCDLQQIQQETANRRISSLASRTTFKTRERVLFSRCQTLSPTAAFLPLKR